jgi:hypothetical protein
LARLAAGGGPIAVAACRCVDTTEPDDEAAQFYDKVPKQFLYSRVQAAAALSMSKGRLDELIRQEDHRGEGRPAGEIQAGGSAGLRGLSASHRRDSGGGRTVPARDDAAIMALPLEVRDLQRLRASQEAEAAVNLQPNRRCMRVIYYSACRALRVGGQSYLLRRGNASTYRWRPQ